MKKIMKNTILSICAIGLLAGCSSKDVEYDNTATNNAQSVDSKAGSISGSSEQAVSDNASVVTNTLKAVTHEGVNSVESEIDGNVVLLESVHFAFDKYNLTDEMREVATANYNKISATQQSYNGLKIKLEGNCDEWGTDEYNYALGLKRAKTAKDALVADGIDAQKIVMVSFGESNPICTQKNTTCWKMNRRVDYRLLP
jgi:peptidoglycan-associated lipoprotein